jgi:hypothetical protein
MTQFQHAILTDLRWIAIVLVTVLSAARITRLIVADSYPPSIKIRMWWDRITHDGSWSELVHCGYCFAPWAMVPIVVWGLVWDWPTAWWIFNGWLGGAYLASMVVSNDGSS